MVDYKHPKLLPRDYSFVVVRYAIDFAQISKLLLANVNANYVPSYEKRAFVIRSLKRFP